jgi:hypothetical protein
MKSQEKGEDVMQREHLHTAGGNVNEHSHYGKSKAWCPWLTLAILATWEAEIRRIAI